MRFLKAFWLTSYLLISIGALSLILAEGHLPFVLLVLGAVLVGGWGEGAGRSLLLAPAWGIPLVGLAFSFFVLDSLWLADTVVDALVHFLMLVQAIKLLQPKTDRDYFQLYTISFIQLVVTSVLASTVLYALFFLLYVLVGSWALTLFHFKRESQRLSSLLWESEGKWTPQEGTPAALPSPSGSPSGVPGPEEGALTAALDPVITLPFFWGTLGINLLVILITGFLFLLFPRVGMGFVQKRFWQSQAMTGFSEEVRLGEIGLIKENSSVVMRVELLGEGPWPIMGLRWRGVALDYYTGRGWRLSHPQRRMYQPDPRGYFKLDPEEAPSQRGMLLKQRFTLNGMDTQVLFGAYPAVGLTGKFFLISMDATGSLYAPSAHYLGTRYILYSLLFPQGRPPRRVAGLRAPPSIQQRYLQLPPLSPRIGRLARQVTQGISDPWEQAKRIEICLKSKYRYTLHRGDPGGREPVEHFLFHEKRGHCEYFASAMVLLLRSLGLPSRLVNGFVEGEWNDFGRYYLVRQRDAHSWVEVYFPAWGWLSFDPTPAGVPTTSGWLGVGGKYWDALQLKWYSYVIDYSLQDQRRLARGVGDRLSTARQLLGEPLRLWSRLSGYLFPLRKEGRKWAWMGVVLSAVLVGVLLYRVRHRIGWAYRGRRGVGSRTVKFYEQLLRVLERQGYSRQEGHTPWEFCQMVLSQEGEAYREVALITDQYYQVRYGGKKLSAEELMEIEKSLQRLEERIHQERLERLEK
ncbi:MAG: DUF3488 domain-containing protein [Candidatus Tectomicrobia bacterium]|uniref:DUF3488 domain-containing protein n=1 Tax=Tectimicrobiota bacterium TaxID=2528274 RepID=A0A932CPP6_UNCTE|nr:DUF3488 domain-containing protein [Candidatus Tectomicrobia bacterium]